MKIQPLFYQGIVGHSTLATILMVGLWSLTLSVSLSFALALSKENSAPIIEATVTSKPDVSELVLEERMGNPSIILGALSVATGTQDLVARPFQARPHDFSYQVSNDLISSDLPTMDGEASFKDLSSGTFPPMWVPKSTGKALLRLRQLYGPGMGIQ